MLKVLGLKSAVDSMVIPGCGNKGKYQGMILVLMVLGRYWGEEWEERQAVPRQMGLQACETWCNPHGC